MTKAATTRTQKQQLAQLRALADPTRLKILAMLKKGDVITHSFHGHKNGILDDGGRILPDVHKAVSNGVNIDVGHGAGSFSFDTAEKAMAQDLIPGTISSDLHQFNVNGPVFDLATTLSKFMHLGLSLEQVIERCTTNPARLFGNLNGLTNASTTVCSFGQRRWRRVSCHGKRRLPLWNFWLTATEAGADRHYGW